MARIKIDLPGNKLADIKIPVRISDINYGNHLGNDAFVSIIHEARVQWLRQYEYSELNFDGAGLIMSELVVEFKNESLYGDIIQVDIYAGEITRVSFELFYKLTTIRNNAITILAKAKTGMITYSYEKKKPVPIPENALRLLTTKI